MNLPMCRRVIMNDLFLSDETLFGCRQDLTR